MEEINNMEQPFCEELQDNLGEQKTQNETDQTQQSQEGSIFGKFKDTASLLNAYNSLQREFTKKSQKLAEMSKKNLNDQTGKLEEEKKTGEAFTKANNENHSSAPETSTFTNANWKTLAKEFLEKNPDAQKHAKEISNILIQDNILAKSPKCFDYAYAMVMAENRVDTETLLKDPTFIEEKILTNSKIKDRIINEFVQPNLRTSQKQSKKRP